MKPPSLGIDAAEDQAAPTTPAPEAETPEAPFEIRDAENKRGTFALVVFRERMPRDLFQERRTSAQQAGGWYSRAWRPTGQPGGFGFPDRGAAEAWALKVSA